LLTLSTSALHSLVVLAVHLDKWTRKEQRRVMMRLPHFFVSFRLTHVGISKPQSIKCLRRIAKQELDTGRWRFQCLGEVRIRPTLHKLESR
jgi:hypothetical protein